MIGPGRAVGGRPRVARRRRRVADQRRLDPQHRARGRELPDQERVLQDGVHALRRGRRLRDEGDLGAQVAVLVRARGGRHDLDFLARLDLLADVDGEEERGDERFALGDDGDERRARGDELAGVRLQGAHGAGEGGGHCGLRPCRLGRGRRAGGLDQRHGLTGGHRVAGGDEELRQSPVLQRAHAQGAPAGEQDALAGHRRVEPAERRPGQGDDDESRDRAQREPRARVGDRDEVVQLVDVVEPLESLAPEEPALVLTCHSVCPSGVAPDVPSLLPIPAAGTASTIRGACGRGLPCGVAARATGRGAQARVSPAREWIVSGDSALRSPQSSP